MLEVCLLMLTMVVRVLWLRAVPPQPLAAVDARGYDLLAHNLLDGVGLSLRRLPPFCPTTLRTPGYPLFLALAYRFAGGVRGAILLQVLLEVLTTALIVRLGAEMGDRRVGRLAALLYALNGTTWRYTGDLYAEILLLPLMALGLWQMVRWFESPRTASAAVMGTAWGAALLVKPNLLYLLLFWLAATALWAMRRDRLRVWWPAPIAAGLLLAPWLLRNGLRTGTWTVSTAFRVNLARVSAVATMAEVRHVPAEPWTPTWEALYDALVRMTAQREGWAIPAVEGGDCAQRRRREAAVAASARQVVLRHPEAALRAHLRGVVRSLLDPGHRFWYAVLWHRPWAETGVVPDIWARIGWSLERGTVGDALLAFWRERMVRLPPEAAWLWWGLWLGRMALWWWGLRGLRRLPLRVRSVLAGTVLYFLLLPGPIAYERFYLPAIPAVVVLVAAGMVRTAPAPPSPGRECARRPRPCPSPR